MDPVFSQAFGTGRTSVLAAALHRLVLLLAARVCVHQRAQARHAPRARRHRPGPHFILPDLVMQSFFLRAQSVRLTLTLRKDLCCWS